MTVYYAQRSDGLIKIGQSRADVRGRLRHLSYEHGPLRLLALEEGSFPDERRRHQQFQRERQSGEWFRPSPRLRAHIRTVADSAGCAWLLTTANANRWKKTILEPLA